MAPSPPARPDRAAPPPRRRGRPATSDPAAVAAVGLELFARQGFDETTADEIAAAAGVSRRTFFRYFPSKNDVVWGDFDRLVASLRADLEQRPGEPMEAIREAVVAFNSFADEALDLHRQRMALILGVPALQAHSTLRYAEWRSAIAEFVARRLDRSPADPLPQLAGHVALAAAVAAYERWLRHDDLALPVAIDEAYRAIDLRLG